MVKRLRLLSAVLLITLLSSCVSQQYVDSLKTSWLGSSGSKLIQQWGYPRQTLSLAGGQKIYVYQGFGCDATCIFNFTVNNKNDTIVKVDHHGCSGTMCFGSKQFEHGP